MSATTSPVVSDKDFGAGPSGDAARWASEIALAKKEADKWLKACARIEKRYRDERTESDNDRRFNILWSNVNTLAPAIYSQSPSPVIGRRYRDKDPVARAAGEILLRCVIDGIEETDLHERLKQVRIDYLLFARGTLWHRYVPVMAPMVGHNGGPPLDDDDAEPNDDGVQITDSMDAEEEIVAEEDQVDYVHLTDFLMSPGRTWAETRWVARAARMTREELKERFKDLTDEQIDLIPLNWKPAAVADNEQHEIKNQQFKRSVVWEIWDKDERKVHFWAEGYTGKLLETLDDPLKLRDFFPCPRPLFGTVTNSTTVPVPDFTEYADQAKMLDTLTLRMARLIDVIKVVGVYDNRWAQLGSLFKEGVENELFPVEQWTEFAAKKGMDGAVQLLGMKEMADVLQVLTVSRQQIKEDLYEITGISDVIRGSTRPEETATAQRLKGRYASMRLTDRQLEFSRFVRDNLRLMGEIMAQHFQPETLIEVSNFMETELAAEEMERATEAIMAQAQQPQGEGMPPMPPPNPQMVQQMAQQAALQLAGRAVALLKDKRSRMFRIDIEDKSTIRADDQEEKASRVEFLAAVGNFIREAAMMPPTMGKTMAPLLGKMLLFGVRGFRAGVEMESAVEDAIGKLDAMAKEPAPPPPPDPALVKAQADAQIAQAELAMKQQQMQADMATAQQAAQLKMGEAALAAQQHEKQNEQDDRQHLIDVARLQADTEKFQAEQVQAVLSHQVEMGKLELEKARAAIDMKNSEIEGNARASEANVDGHNGNPLKDIQTTLASHADTLTKAMDHIQTLHKTISAPKRIVRGPDGKISHVETMTGGA